MLAWLWLISRLLLIHRILILLFLNRVRLSISTTFPLHERLFWAALSCCRSFNARSSALEDMVNGRIPCVTIEVQMIIFFTGTYWFYRLRGWCEVYSFWLTLREYGDSFEGGLTSCPLLHWERRSFSDLVPLSTAFLGQILTLILFDSFQDRIYPFCRKAIPPSTCRLILSP